MGVMPSSLATMFVIWGAVTAVMVALIIYGNTLDTHEDEEIYLNKTEEEMIGGDQKALVARMERLKKMIFSLAVVSGVLFLASASIWVYIGLTRG